jgi:hypothetical protein
MRMSYFSPLGPLFLLIGLIAAMRIVSLAFRYAPIVRTGIDAPFAVLVR